MHCRRSGREQFEPPRARLVARSAGEQTLVARLLHIQRMRERRSLCPFLCARSDASLSGVITIALTTCHLQYPGNANVPKSAVTYSIMGQGACLSTAFRTSVRRRGTLLGKFGVCCSLPTLTTTSARLASFSYEQVRATRFQSSQSAHGRRHTAYAHR